MSKKQRRFGDRPDIKALAVTTPKIPGLGLLGIPGMRYAIEKRAQLEQDAMRAAAWAHQIGGHNLQDLKNMRLGDFASLYPHGTDIPHYVISTLAAMTPAETTPVASPPPARALAKKPSQKGANVHDLIADEAQKFTTAVKLGQAAARALAAMQAPKEPIVLDDTEPAEAAAAPTTTPAKAAATGYKPTYAASATAVETSATVPSADS